VKQLTIIRAVFVFVASSCVAACEQTDSRRAIDSQPSDHGTLHEGERPSTISDASTPPPTGSHRPSTPDSSDAASTGDASVERTFQQVERRSTAADASALAAPDAAPVFDAMTRANDCQPQQHDAFDYSSCADKSSVIPSEPNPWAADPCPDSPKTDNSDSAGVLASVQLILHDAGVGPNYRFAYARTADAENVELGYIFTLGWFQAFGTALLPRETTDPRSTAAFVAERFCLNLPQIAGYDDVLASADTCSNATPFLCANIFTSDCKALVRALGDNARNAPRAAGCRTVSQYIAIVDATTGDLKSCESMEIGLECVDLR